MENSYEEYKEQESKKSRGLGDDIAKLTKATGLDKVADKVAETLGLNDCGCDERQDRMNKLFNYGRPEILENDEYQFLKDYFLSDPRPILQNDREKRDKMFDIFNRIFKQDKPYTNCGLCIKEVVSELEKVITIYL